MYVCIHKNTTMITTYIFSTPFFFCASSHPIQPPSCAMPRAKPPGTGRPKRTKAQATLQSPVTVNSGTKLSALLR